MYKKLIKTLNPLKPCDPLKPCKYLRLKPHKVVASRL